MNLEPQFLEGALDDAHETSNLSQRLLPPQSPLTKHYRSPVSRIQSLSPSGQTPTREPKEDEFEELSVLGVGSFSMVFKVRSKKDPRLVYALKKVTRPAIGTRQKLAHFKEVWANKMLWDKFGENSGCVSVLRGWEEDSQLNILMELCERGTLESFLNRSLGRRVQPEDLLWRWVNDLATSVSKVHAAELLHLDIKPENVFVTADMRLKLGDLGLAQSAHESGNSRDVMEGDSRYLAPEMLLEPPAVSTAADIFSLGLTYLEISTGLQLPRNGTDGVLWHQLRDGTLIDFESLGCPKIPTELLGLIRRMLHPKPSQRPSAQDILAIPKVAEAPIPEFMPRVDSLLSISTPYSSPPPPQPVAPPSPPSPDHSHHHEETTRERRPEINTPQVQKRQKMTAASPLPTLNPALPDCDPMVGPQPMDSSSYAHWSGGTNLSNGNQISTVGGGGGGSSTFGGAAPTPIFWSREFASGGSGSADTSFDFLTSGGGELESIDDEAFYSTVDPSFLETSCVLFNGDGDGQPMNDAPPPDETSPPATTVLSPPQNDHLLHISASQGHRSLPAVPSIRVSTPSETRGRTGSSSSVGGGRKPRCLFPVQPSDTTSDQDFLTSTNVAAVAVAASRSPPLSLRTSGGEPSALLSPRRPAIHNRRSGVEQTAPTTSQWHEDSPSCSAISDQSSISSLSSFGLTQLFNTAMTPAGLPSNLSTNQKFSTPNNCLGLLPSSPHFSLSPIGPPPTTSSVSVSAPPKMVERSPLNGDHFLIAERKEGHSAHGDGGGPAPRSAISDFFRRSSWKVLALNFVLVYIVLLSRQVLPTSVVHPLNFVFAFLVVLLLYSANNANRTGIAGGGIFSFSLRTPPPRTAQTLGELFAAIFLVIVLCVLLGVLDQFGLSFSQSVLLFASCSIFFWTISLALCGR